MADDHYDQESETIARLKKIQSNSGSEKEEENNSILRKNKNGEEIILGWEAMEREHHEKGSGWYIGVLVFMIIGVIVGAITRNWPTIIAFILLAVALILTGHHTPRIIQITLTNKGIKINNRQFLYQDIAYFWIIDNEETSRFGFREKDSFKIEREVSLHDIEPNIIREILGTYLDEDIERKESTMSKLRRFFKV